jgi:hypothetical protein
MSPRLLLTIVAGACLCLDVEAAGRPAGRPVPRSIELNGAVRIGGEAVSNLRLTFQHKGVENEERRVRIKSDGTYRIKLEDRDTDVICATIEPRRPFNSYSNCKRFAAGVHRLDFDLPPGSIRVEIPPFRRRAAHWVSVRVESAKATAGRSFKPAKGFRGDYFAADFGIYVITVIDPAHEVLLASWPVTLSADQPVVGVKLAIPSVQGAPSAQTRRPEVR